MLVVRCYNSFMCAYILVKPSKDYINEINSFKKEIESSNTKYKFEGCAGLQNFDDINEWLHKLDMYSNKDTCPIGFVPSTLYLYVNENNKIVGMIDIRHHIDHPVLSIFGGHIGYSIAPSERGKGLGTLMLKEGLAKCKDLGIKKVLITCYEENIASEKVIIKNGGIFDKVVENEGSRYKRFWISI